MSNFDAFNNFGFQTQSNPPANNAMQNQNMMMNFNTQLPNQQQQQGFQNQFNTQQQPVGQNVFSQFEGFGATPNQALGQGQPQMQQPLQQQQGLQQQNYQQPFMNQQMGQQQQQMVPFNQQNMMHFQQPVNQMGQIPHIGQQMPLQGQQMQLQGQQMPLQGQQMQFPGQQMGQMDQFGNPIQQQQIPFEAPKPLKLRVKLENSERGVYSALYTQVDNEETNKIKQEKAMELFNRANLNPSIIQNIWQICVPEGDTMDKDAFYVALRLIAYAQNNVEVSSQSIYQNIKAPSNPKFAPKVQPVQPQPQQIPTDLSLGGMGSAPQIQGQQLNNGLDQMQNQQMGMQQFGQPQQQFGQQGMPQQQQQLSQFCITPPLYQKYEQYFDATDVKKIGRVDGLQAKEIFSKSKLPNESLKLIWKLADSEKKGYLTKLQFIIMVHFVYLAKKGVTVPQVLPPELVKFIQTNGQSVFQLPNEIPIINGGNNEMAQQQPQQQWQNNIQAAPIVNQQSPQTFNNNQAMPDLTSQFNANLTTPPAPQQAMTSSPSQPNIGQFGTSLSGNSGMNNPQQPIQSDVFNQIDFMNQTGTTAAATTSSTTLTTQVPSLTPIINQDNQQKIQANTFDLMDNHTNNISNVTSQLNNLNINDFSALNNIQPIVQQPLIQPPPAIIPTQNPILQQQQQPMTQTGGISMQQTKEFENSFLQQQQQLNATFEDTRATHSNFMEQQKQQIDIFNQIIEAYTKTNKKFADENIFLKEEIKNLQDKQQTVIQQLHEIGRNFHQNLQANKQLRQEVIETASNAITNISNKATEIIQNSNGQQAGYNNGYQQEAYIDHHQQNTNSDFNNPGFTETHQGFDISQQFNNQADTTQQQQQWGGGFDNSYPAADSNQANW